MAKSSNLPPIGESDDDDRILARALGPRTPQPPPTEDAFQICTVSLWLHFSDNAPVLSIRPDSIPTIPDEVVVAGVLLNMREEEAAVRVRARARACVNPLGLIIPKRRRSLRRWSRRG